MRVLDTHLHLWDPEVLTYEWLSAPLLRSFGPKDLADDLPSGADPVFEFVFVQAECSAEQSVAEVDWVTSLADRVPLRGVVARAPLESHAATMEHLDAYAERPLVVGVRRLLQSEPQGFCLTREFLRSARELEREGLAFDACVRWWQLRDVIALADAVPELRIVLDHMGKPPVGASDGLVTSDSHWARSLRELAERPNVACKLSGLPAEFSDEWTPAKVSPFLDIALDAFGPGRLLFGSDWPVSGRYLRWVDAVVLWLSNRLGEDDCGAILTENAERFYRLS